MTTKIPVELSSTPGIVDGSNATAITIDSSENVGIGCTDPQTPLEIDTSTANYRIQFTHTSGQNQIKSIDSNHSTMRSLFYDAADHIYQTSGTERMRIASGGGVAIGTTTPDGVSNLTVKSQNATAGQEFVSLHHQASSGTIYFMSFMTGSGNGSDVGYITFSGTTGAFAAASDISLKENVRDLPEGLDVITQLKPRLFDWKEEGKGKDQVGFIAQEVEEIKPEWVHQKEDIKLISTNLPDTIPYLIKAIQEQQTQIEALQSEINTLKGE